MTVHLSRVSLVSLGRTDCLLVGMNEVELLFVFHIYLSMLLVLYFLFLYNFIPIIPCFPYLIAF